MARPAAAPLERVRKVLLHEQRTGCQDRAAVGGLEHFLCQAASGEIGESEPARAAWLAAAARRLAGYAGWPVDRRQGTVAALIRELDGHSLEHGAGTGHVARSLARGRAGGAQQVAGPGSIAQVLVARSAAVDGSSSPAPRALDGQRGRTLGAARPHRREDRIPAAPSPDAQHHRISSPQPPDGQRRRAGTTGAGRVTAGRGSPKRAARATSPGSLTPLTPVGELPGVGPKAVAALARLDIHCIHDLLYHLPRRHLDRRSILPIAQVRPGQVVTILGSVWQVQTRRSPVQRRLLTEAIIHDGSGFCHAVWFNQPYLARTLSRPGKILFSGRAEYGYDGALQLVAPEFEFNAEESLHAGRLVPFYPKTEGITDKALRTWVRSALAAAADHTHDHVPAAVRAAEDLPALRDALWHAHFPDDEAQREAALRRLAFDEFLLIQLGVLRRRREWQEGQPGIVLQAGPDLLQEFEATLPFALTGAQRRVLGEILADMARPTPMSRLLQGEVGSGKTVVAACACLVAVRSGYQAAVMAPTEVLAQQHFQSFRRLLAPFGARVALVSGSQKRKEKAEIWEACRTGEVDVLVGTHALIQDEGEFFQLGLVIVDEQHRFGVRQRGALRRKGYNPDVLVMTATPIPRTLALSIYGDLDISTIDVLPPGRAPIRTFWIAPENRHHAYDFVRKQVRAGRQAFIICPLIEDSDRIEARSAKAEYERLRRQFPDLRLGLLHGKLPPKDKDAVMVQFRDGALDVLVSTAVVEVGIDVPNATVMLVEGADRFGLAQLHQFRGRVGRGDHQSYCLLLSDTAGADANPRLNVLVSTHDGFALAEEDLKLRGPGEFFGTRQSGLPDLKVARLSDGAILEAARRQAQRIMDDDPLLAAPEHAALAAQVDAFWRTGGEASG